MLPEVTYQRYQELGGTLGEDAFNASLRAGMASVRQIICFNVPDDTNMEAYERAVCAAVEVDAHYGASGGVGEGAASMTLGKFSIFGASDGTNPYDVDMSRVIKRELSGSGLLYRGLS